MVYKSDISKIVAVSIVGILILSFLFTGTVLPLSEIPNNLINKDKISENQINHWNNFHSNYCILFHQ